MSIKNVIDRIKLFLQEENAVELVDVKTQDGTILSYDGELTTGVEIFILDENGRTPAPDGEYILEDGTKLSVAGGKIEEVEAPEVAPEIPEGETPEMPMPDMTPVSGSTAEVDAACKPKKLFDIAELTVDDLADYPWDKCIADQKAAGYSEEVANKICGAIRSKNMSEEMSVKMDSIKQENNEIKELLNQLAQNLSAVSFKEEVKRDMVKDKVETKLEKVADPLKTIKSNDLNNILKNMYKK